MIPLSATAAATQAGAAFQDKLANFSYLVASILFILCLGGLSSPKSARRGLFMGEAGMALAVVGTLLKKDIVSYEFILAGIVVGGAIGVAISLRIPMTKMPERIAFSHAFGGLATGLVGIAEFYKHTVDAAQLGPDKIPFGPLTPFKAGALGFEAFLGLLTFTGSIMAFGKLQGIIPGRPITWPGQNYTNVGAFLAAILALGYCVYDPTNPNARMVFYGICSVGLIVGVTAVLPIGGADMPVVISLLNSYAGLAACATGFALDQKVLIISGALDGSSGILLSLLMSKAMNRSFSNVLFGAFGTDTQSLALTTTAAKPFNESTVEEAGEVLKSAQSVIVIPGYGMAVSQAQHAVRDLASALEKEGVEVRYAIHPVAGRMPGHMNVLLAEANVPYDKLFDLDDINDDFERTDAVIVVGANDVVNPAAKKDTSSPIYGMPVFNVELAKTVFVLKRSMNAGFSGIENELFFYPNTTMVLGDAKKTIIGMANAVKGTGGGHGH